MRKNNRLLVILVVIVSLLCIYTSIGKEGKSLNITHSSILMAGNSSNNELIVEQSAERNKEAGACEGEAQIDVKFRKIDGTYYTIECERKVVASFDYGADGDDNETSRQLYAGQGFGFSIILRTIDKCEKKFNAHKWIATYENTLNILKAIDDDINESNCKNKIDSLSKKNSFASSDNAKNANGLCSNLQELIRIVDTYNKFSPDSDENDKYNEQASLDFSYKVKNKPVKLSEQKPNQSVFEKTIKEGSYKMKDLKYDQEMLKLDFRGDKPANGILSNENNPRYVIMTPKEIYISTTGELTYNSKNNYSGGNRIYIDNYADEQTITTNITLTRLAGSDYTITNNNCTIEVKGQNIKYRPIDVSNPFINSEWEIGKNWLNSKFDFRSVIKANIWSTSDNYAKYEDGAWKIG